MLLSGAAEAVLVTEDAPAYSAGAPKLLDRVRATQDYMRTRKLPNDDRSCGWYATLPAPAPPRRVTADERADCVVVGAGFTGLAAARQLARHRPEWRVIVLEASRVGFGASGRNSGFVVDVGHYDRKLGLEGNRRRVRLGRAGLEDLRELVREHAIDCSWTDRGRIHGAVADVGMRQLEEFCRGADQMGEPYEVLDTARLAAITGMSYYRAAVRTPGAAMVQPAALVRGLAAALPPSVELYEESPVRTVEQGAKFRLEAGDGVVITNRLLLATNGFTPSVGFLRSRMFPMFTFASLTRALTASEQSALGRDSQWGLVPEERMGTTVRRTCDQRVLIRNTVRYSPELEVSDAWRRNVRDIHLRSFRSRFPTLAEVDFEYTWGGVMGISMNSAQFFGRIADDVYASGAYNGVGVAMGSISGKLLADLVVGADSGLLRDIQALPGPTWIPPEPLLGIAVRFTLTRLQARAGAEL
jgi:glycine/D-amino acid oxidase-like deaminating enzyme